MYYIIHSIARPRLCMDDDQKIKSLVTGITDVDGKRKSIRPIHTKSDRLPTLMKVAV